jgi:CHAT domain-containing protein/SIR2-like protein
VSTLMSYAELEIGLHRHQAELYEVELRFSNPASEAETAPVHGNTSIDPQALLPLQLRPREYGLALAAGLFADPAVAAIYAKVKTAVESSDQFLRVKLFVGPSAPELHRLRWELLADPETRAPLATSEKILLSRFGTSQNWRNIRLRPKTDLRALVAVSAPSNLDLYQLAPVDLDGEIERARENLKGIQIKVAGKDAPVTLDRLIDGLRDGIDILYLVCHGALLEKGPRLWLQDESGKVKVTSGDELALRVSELAEAPRLVVLSSCESAGSEQASTSERVTAGELVTLAPLLAEAGVPAVLAMQGKISMETVKKAMPVFFAELLKDGQIDRALAVARGSVRERPDSWMPALFLRLKGGKIWYEPGFGEGEGDFAKWQAIVHSVRSGQFTPIVGAGLGERVYGNLRDAARELAEEAGFPLAEHQRYELPQVSQYLRVSQSVVFARDKFKEELRRQILRRHDMLPAELAQASLPNLLRAVGQKNREADPADPYKLLAQLPARVFITANPDNLLQEALKAEGKNPEVFFFNWRMKTDEPGRYDREPTPKDPLVFHILGYFKDDESLVLTEDDYFDYLIGLIQYKPRIPKVIPYATANTSLLFLGFQLTDWSFRVLFRLIMSQEGSSRRKEFAHVAVQVDPEEHTLINPQKARKYLKEYFGDSDITIFWGSAGEFLQELERRLASVEKAIPAAATSDREEW